MCVCVVKMRLSTRVTCLMESSATIDLSSSVLAGTWVHVDTRVDDDNCLQGFGESFTTRDLHTAAIDQCTLLRISYSCESSATPGRYDRATCQ